MIKYIILMCPLLFVVDWFIYKLLFKEQLSLSMRRCVRTLCIATSLSPLVAISFLSLDLGGQGRGALLFGSWVILIFMMSLAPRIFYYPLALFRSKALNIVGGALSLFVVGVMVWGATIGRTRIELSEVVDSESGIPAAFDDFRVVHISDLHVGVLINQTKELQRVVDMVNAQSPSLVVFSGDLVHISADELTPEVMNILRGIRSEYGVASVIGNHDIGVYINDADQGVINSETERIREKQRQLGWHVLEDQTIYITRGEDSISVTGIAYSAELQEFRHSGDLPQMDLSRAYSGVSSDMWNLSISHLPQLWDDIMDLGYGDYTLSGHVHAMQIKLFAGNDKRGWSPAEWMYDQWSGLYIETEDGEREGALYINDGIASVGWPMRIGAYPEVTSITLKSKR